MAYDYDSPQMNVEPARETIKDPHVILEMVREMDLSIDRAQREKEKLIGMYQEVMKGFEQHYHVVVNRPQESAGEEVGFGSEPKFGF